MFAITALESAAVCLAFKYSDEAFAELTAPETSLPPPI